MKQQSTIVDIDDLITSAEKQLSSQNGGTEKQYGREEEEKADQTAYTCLKLVYFLI